jgi:hypothetical protein
MIFLNSFWFWGAMAAAGISVPVVIHLFSRHHSKPVEWAAMELLRKAMAVRARRVRMEDLILLALRVLAIAMIALAFARPALTHPGAARVREASGTGVVIAIDGSFSMGHKPGLNSRFDLALERVRAVLGGVSSGDQVSLVLMGSRPRVILRNVTYEPGRLDGELDGLAPLAEPLDLAVCLDEVRELMNEIDLPGRECYIVTDAQAVTWKDLPDGALSALREMRRTGPVSLLPVDSPDSGNIAVTQLTASGIPREGALVRYVADIHNTGSEPAREVTVRLLMDGIPVDKQVADTIPPGGILPVSLFARFSRRGMHVIEAELENDSLLVDNRRYLLADVRDEISVLCVDGDPSDEPFRGEVDFLKAALRPGLPEETGSGGIRVTTVPYGGLTGAEIQRHDVVILANVPDLPREEAAALGAFVTAGGGLMVFAGDNTTIGADDPSMRCADGTPLLPGALLGLSDAGGAEGESATVWNVRPLTEDHPVTRSLMALPKEQWSAILFERYVKTVPHEGARVLMRLDPGGDPLLLSRQTGRGQVLFFTSSADRDWNDMMVHPAYLMMVRQSVMSLSRKFNGLASTVSRPLVFEVPEAETSPTVKIIDPAGGETLLQVTGHEGRRAAVLASADLPGVYEMKTENGGDSLKLAVNVDPAESAVAVLENRDLDEIASRLSLGVVDGGDDVSGAVRANRAGREIWRFLILAALCLLVLESLISRRLVRRMAVAPDDSRPGGWRSPAGARNSNFGPI